MPGQNNPLMEVINAEQSSETTMRMKKKKKNTTGKRRGTYKSVIFPAVINNSTE